MVIISRCVKGEQCVKGEHLNVCKENRLLLKGGNQSANFFAMLLMCTLGYM